MTPEEDTRERLIREAEVMESRLIRDVDALAHSRPVETMRTLKDKTATIRAVALGVAAVAAFVVALFAIRALRRRRQAG
jgi:hypothetical protein